MIKPIHILWIGFFILKHYVVANVVPSKLRTRITTKTLDMKLLLLASMAIALVVSLGSCSGGKKVNNEKEPVHEHADHDGHYHDAHMHEGHDHAGHDHGAEVSDEKVAMLCGGCGQVKGSEKCCVDGVEKCTKCDMDKGSPGCCEINEDTKLCSHCGEIEGAEKCCAEGAEVCSKCDLHAGSPGCCKI